MIATFIKCILNPFYQHIKDEVTPLHFAAMYGEFEICHPFEFRF